MIKIRNLEKIIANGQTHSLRRCRAMALECFEQAVNAVEPKQLVKSKMKVENNLLQVNSCSFDLEKFKNIYVVGGGKAGSEMAQAIEELLGNHVTAGAVNIPYGTKQNMQVIELNEASHPVPDEAGVKGSLRIMAIVDQTMKYLLL